MTFDLVCLFQLNNERNPLEEMAAAEESGEFVYQPPGVSADDDDADFVEAPAAEKGLLDAVQPKTPSNTPANVVSRNARRSKPSPEEKELFVSCNRALLTGFYSKEILP